VRIVTVNTLALLQGLVNIFAFAYLVSLRSQLRHRWNYVQIPCLFLMAAAAKLLSGAKQLKSVFGRILIFVAEFAHADLYGLVDMLLFQVGTMTFPVNTVFSTFRGLFIRP
jgi:hypothetical protein